MQALFPTRSVEQGCRGALTQHLWDYRASADGLVPVPGKPEFAYEMKMFEDQRLKP